ncbi:MAG: DUF4445 domain-containing protein [Phycisphaerae bacterium]|nr:DUF4445 domain-containing protein [Phycisphaerae bacterium]
MPEKQDQLTFEPTGRAVSVLEGSTILEAAAGAGLVLDTPCGGAGTCGKCRVQVTRGAGHPTEADRLFFSPEHINDGWRLACQNPTSDGMTVHIPPTSLFAGGHQIVEGATVGQPGDIKPAVRKAYVELSPPTLADAVPDLLRLERQIGPFEADLPLLRQIPSRLRTQGFTGTAVLAGRRLIDFESGNTANECFGVAFDIGTTTLVASLVDLCTGQERAVASRLNPQASLGDDVLSRIRHSFSCPNGLDELRRAVIEEAARMVEALYRETGVSARHTYEIAFAGNTTMQHILCGVDPSSLGEVPFAPACGRGLLVSARDMEIPIHPRGTAYVFPVIGGFVGGDTVAGMLAARVDSADRPALMVDIGTNGEIVLAHDGRLLAASTAAGPAFEGARISCGMRGTQGAIEKVILDDDVRLQVIGGLAPLGICGSGMIDLLAGLLRHDIVSPDGRLCRPEELPKNLSPALARRVRVDPNNHTRFVVADPPEGKPGKTISLTQRDIRELQLGCGAIRAGISILLREAGLAPAALKSVLLAGGFGSFIRRNHARRIGLIPTEVDHARIHHVGNTSLAGARLALLSVVAREHAETLARQTRHVELSVDAGFQSAFADAMIFPEP